MSFGQKFGMAAAMEEIEAAEVEVAEEVEAMPEDEETVDGGLLEVAEAESAVEQGGEAIEKATDDAETLADVADQMEATEETGGMDESAAAIANVAVEALYNRLSMRRAKQLPAMEAFGSQSSRLKATKIAVENIRENLKKVWDAIVSMMQKVGEFLKNFFKSVFDTNTRIKERAEKLLKAVSGLEGAAAKSTIDAKGVSAALSSGGKVNAGTLAKQLNETKATLSAMSSLNAFFASAAKAAGNADAYVKSAEEFDKFDSPEIPSEGSSKAADGKFGTAPEGMAYFTIGEELPGNQVLVYLLPAKPEAGAASFAAMSKVKISMEKADKDVEVAKEVPTLSFTEMEEVLKAVIDSAVALDTVKAESAEIEKAYKDMIAGTKKAAIEAAKAVVKDTADKNPSIKDGVTEAVSGIAGAASRARAVQRYLQAVGNATQRPTVLLSKYVVQTCKASMDYVVKSAAQYKGPKVEAAAPADDKTAEAA